jgi:hypothetical protein
MNEVRNLSSYEDLSVNINGDVIDVKTPWLTLECEANSSEKIDISAVLKSLFRYPICYIHPPQKNAAHILASSKSSGDSRIRSNIETVDEVLRQVSPDLMNDLPWPESKKFEWNTSQVLEFSKISDLDIYDGLAAFSVLRKKLHSTLNVGAERDLQQKMIDLKAAPEEFKKLIGTYIYQNYYITKHAEAAMKPAVEQTPAVSEKIAEYLASEVGHDRLIAKSLAKLDYSTSPELTLFEETKLLIDILKYSAKSHVLSFALMIDFFESGSMSSVHPLTPLLKDTSYSSAALPLQMHRDINVRENHSNEAINFLLSPSTCTATEIKIATRLTELAVITKKRLIDRLLAL